MMALTLGAVVVVGGGAAEGVQERGVVLPEDAAARDKTPAGAYLGRAEAVPPGVGVTVLVVLLEPVERGRGSDGEGWEKEAHKETEGGSSSNIALNGRIKIKMFKSTSNSLSFRGGRVERALGLSRD